MKEDMTNEISDISYETVGRFTAIPHSFIEGSKHLSPHARWVFVALMYCRDDKTGLASMTYYMLQELTGLSMNLIAKGIKELEAEEQQWVWLHREKRFGLPTLHRLLLPPEADEVPDMQ